MNDGSEALGADVLRAHETWIRERGTGRLDWVDRDLRGATLANAHLCGARFTRCSLRGAILNGTDLADAEFTECDLSEVRAEGAILADARFLQCRLDHGQFATSDARGLRIRGGTLIASDWRAALLQNASFVGANLTRACLREAHLRRSSFDDVDLRAADLSRADATWSRFQRVDLRGANLDELNVTSAFLESCALHAHRGRPLALESFTLREPDFSEAWDGSDVREGGELEGFWSR